MIKLLVRATVLHFSIEYLDHIVDFLGKSDRRAIVFHTLVIRVGQLFQEVYFFILHLFVLPLDVVDLVGKTLLELEVLRGVLEDLVFFDLFKDGVEKLLEFLLRFLTVAASLASVVLLAALLLLGLLLLLLTDLIGEVEGRVHVVIVLSELHEYVIQDVARDAVDRVHVPLV